MSGETATRVTRLKLRDVRCFAAAEIEPDARATLLVGDNAQGKTSLLEAFCILLRLQSPRAARLAHVVRHGARGLVVDGHCGGRHLQFYHSTERRKLALDSVGQKAAREYLDVGKIVYFSNEDIRLVSDGASARRRFLDFAGAQVVPAYRATLREYERALRSRNRLLKLGATAGGREIDAFTGELVRHGRELASLRAGLVARLAPAAGAALAGIAGSGEAALATIAYHPSGGGDLSRAVRESHAADREAGQTLIGPHRDDLALAIDGHPASEFASEGQQRTLALALRLGVADLIREVSGGRPPLYLIDDVFGELDRGRRNALLGAIPPAAQMITTTTHLDWIDDTFSHALVLRVQAGKLVQA